MEQHDRGKADLGATSAPQAIDSCRIFLLSPNDIFAAALERMLVGGGSGRLVFCADDDQQCLDALARQEADILLINAKLLRYPLGSFFHRFHHLCPNLRIIVFGHEDHDAFVRNLVCSGCRGFINDEITRETLRAAFFAVMEGHLWVDRGLLTQIAVEEFEFQRMIEQRFKERIGLLNDELCLREADVFCLILEGLSTQEIADALHVSKQSVKAYLHRLFIKFGVSNRSQLIVSAFERVCPVDHLLDLLHETLNHSRTWKAPASTRRSARPRADRTD